MSGVRQRRDEWVRRTVCVCVWRRWWNERVDFVYRVGWHGEWVGDERRVHRNTMPLHRRLEWHRNGAERRMLYMSVSGEYRRAGQLEPWVQVDGGAPAPAPAPCGRAGERRLRVEGVVVVRQRAPEFVVRRGWAREWLMWR